MAALADWLFVGPALPGAVTGGFGLAVLVVAGVFHVDLLRHTRARWALGLALLMCAALVHDPSMLAVLLFVGAMLMVMSSAPLASGAGGVMALAVRAAWRGMAVSVVDAVTLPSRLAAVGARGRLAAIAGAWAVPLSCAAVFVLLFAAANPIIDQWLASLDRVASWGELPPVERVLFWAVVTAGVWWLLRSRLPRPDGVTERVGSAGVPGIEAPMSALLPASAIVRSMVLFNLLFAVQNGLDVAYLWGTSALPAGFTYASYAHRGAYPLMATTLIAAVFVLVAFRGGARERPSLLARTLMYVWIVQNILLVSSTIWRMMLYVEAYSMTYARLATLVWMGLVALGLVLMVARFWFARSNRWLVDKNLTALFATLVAATFVDAGGFIADCNVRNSRDVGGRGVVLDLGYLARIGPRALPALKTYVAATAPDPIDGAASLADYRRHQHALRLVEHLEAKLAALQGDWRRWTVFQARLKQRLGS